MLAAAASLARSLDPAGRAWEAKIEAERGRLHASTESMVVQPFEYTYDPVDEGKVDSERVSEIARANSKPVEWGRWLHALVRKLEPSHSVEIGTCLGLSTAYQAAAMATNNDGHMATFEGSSARLRVAGDLLANLELDDRVRLVQGGFDRTVPEYLDSIAGAVDYAFVDGNHSGPATIAYFEMLLPRLSDRAVVVFDDIRWSAGMKDAWRRLRQHPSSGLAVDMYSVGVIAVQRPKRRIFAPL
jgi:predicted O-methyltransferase YrrM